MPVYCGKNCYGLIPIPEHDPEYWQVTIQNCDNSSKCRTATLEIDLETFKKVQPGQYLDLQTPAPKQ